METLKKAITTRTVLVQPVYSTRHPLAGENKKVPLTVFDRAALDLFVPTVLAYPAPAPSNEALKEGLRRAVALYPHLAGRLAVDDRGRRFLHVNDEGVLVVEAAVVVSADLSDVLLADGSSTTHTNVVVDELYPTLPEDNVGAPLLQMKLNRYRCGGLIVGIICHHHVADGHSMSAFFTTWASAVRAAGKDFSIIPPAPFLNRAATAVPRATPAPVFDHRSIEFKGPGDDADGGRTASCKAKQAKIKNVTVHFTDEFIADLKARVQVIGGGGGVRYCSTFQCLLAHVWKKVTAARGLELEEFTQVRVAVNCRGRASPAVPTGFFGNMVLWAFPRLQVKDLLGSSYGRVVDAIRDAVARVDGEYIQSFVDFGASGEEEERLELVATAGTTLCPDLEVDSWLGFQFHQMDLGTGPPCAFLTPDLPIEGLMIFVPSSRAAKGGGVDLFMAVAECHVDAFQQICHSVG